MAYFLVFDIETIIDPELPITDLPEGQKLPPSPHHRVVAIGALLFSGPDYEPKRLGIVGRDSNDEREILFEFIELVEKYNPTLVSYNGRGFDLPVIACRALRHGLTFAAYYQRRDMRYRFSDAGHLDLMDYLADFGASRATRLDVMAKLCGMPGKVGVDGKDVGPMVHRGEIEKVRDYCLCDVVQTAGVFLRCELLRGSISKEIYVGAMSNLIQLVDNDLRVRDVSQKLNRQRLLLEESALPSLDPDDEAQLLEP